MCVCVCARMCNVSAALLSLQLVTLTANEAEDVWVSGHIKRDRTGICNTHTHTGHKCTPEMHLHRFIHQHVG